VIVPLKLFNREIFFDHVREDPFGGELDQDQVDGMNAILDAWEHEPRSDDLRWLAYALATTMHETASTMQPIEEYEGDEQPYGAVDPETDQAYWGRGFVQLTHRENYARADKELGLYNELSCEWHAENALVPDLAAEIMFQGMTEGWFRGDDEGRHTLDRYFNEDTDDPVGARETINGDAGKVPDWSGGISIGDLIAGYHTAFLLALEAATIRADEQS